MAIILQRLLWFFSSVTNIALALSIVANVTLAMFVKKLYDRNQKVQDQQTEFLKNVMPFILVRSDKKND